LFKEAREQDTVLAFTFFQHYLNEQYIMIINEKVQTKQHGHIALETKNSRITTFTAL